MSPLGRSSSAWLGSSDSVAHDLLRQDHNAQQVTGGDCGGRSPGDCLRQDRRPASRRRGLAYEV